MAKAETKTARMQHCRDLIDRNRMGVPFNVVDLSEFMELTGEVLLAAKRMKNPRFPNDPRHVRVRWPDGEWSEMSWTKRIEKPNESTQLKKVLRNEIQADLADFRSAVAELFCFCIRCNGVDDLTADHETVPFDTIAVDWIKLNSPVAVAKCSDGIGYRIADRDKAANWITYHTPSGHPRARSLMRPGRVYL
jgi:hypothetical protein